VSARVKAVSAGFGVAFGFLISWGQFSDPDRIGDMLRLADPYLYLMMASGIAVGTLGSRLLRRAGARSLVTRTPIAWATERPARRHIAGAATFGLGWALADSCPAPIAAQLTQGVGWSLFTIAGILGGVLLYLRRQDARAATTPAPDARAVPARARA
jgi:uncharacterized membrane protein YedE/YeeE